VTQAYPLAWPEGWPRTPSHRQGRSRFKVTPDRARRNLLDQIRMLGAKLAVISSNVPIRQDGQPYADAARRVIYDAGVAVYFQLDGKPMAMACDLYQTPHENMHSLGHAIEHLRGLDRHGGGHMIERAFTGFSALPPPSSSAPMRAWPEVLGVSANATRAEVEAAYREQAKRAHPDAPTGSHERMTELNTARDAALNARGQ
jgi:hypothetical protein